VTDEAFERAANHFFDVHGNQAEEVARRRAKAIDPEHQSDQAQHWLRIAERVRVLHMNRMLRAANARSGPSRSL
jgi:hypothetical protein